MRWRKLGRIFVASGQRPWMRSHTSMPFAEPLENGLLRIWFTPRDDRNRSHLGWLEIDLQRPQYVVRLATDPTLAPGAPDQFDATGAMGSCLVRHGEQRWHYYIGWSQPGPDPFHVAIGVATARGEGTVFARHFDNPVLDRNTHDPMFVSTPYVNWFRGRWHMWYLSGTGWPDPAKPPNYNVRHATSIDGIRWETEPAPCIDVAHPGEVAVARPAVIRDMDCWRMWYCHRGEGYAYRIGYAESPDGLSWTRKDDSVGIGPGTNGWDSEMTAYPFVFDHDGARYMLYSGNGFGRAGMGLAVLEQD